LYIKITWPKLIMFTSISSNKNVLWLILQPIQCKFPDDLLGTDKRTIDTQTAYMIPMIRPAVNYLHFLSRPQIIYTRSWPLCSILQTFLIIYKLPCYKRQYFPSSTNLVENFHTWSLKHLGKSKATMEHYYYWAITSIMCEEK
jgi:hypothetical protein